MLHCPLYMNNSKLLATIGPVCDSEEDIEKLVHAGADAFRLNFSHDSQDNHKTRIRRIRSVENKIGTPICIVADLQGAKLRVGTFADSNGVDIAAGDIFEFRLKGGQGDRTGVTLPHPEIFEAAEEGMNVLVEDGRLQFRVTKVTPDVLTTTVVIGGTIKDKKGVNIPDVHLPIGALTEKDKNDMEFALEHGVDWIALSFVQRPDDVIQAKNMIRDRAGIIAKIEKPLAVKYIDEIIKESDAIMVARGDLGVEMRQEEIPGIQKKIIRKCRRARKPVIIATQMLESMIHAAVPTRAEVSDVANALYDGADVTMLSGETSYGKHPVLSITTMRNILIRTESDHMFSAEVDTVKFEPPKTHTDIIVRAAYQTTQHMNAKAIVIFSETGNMAMQCASYRPTCPLLCITSNMEAARRLILTWSVKNILVDANISRTNNMVEKAIQIARKSGVAESGDTITIISGTSFGERTNTLSIVTV